MGVWVWRSEVNVRGQVSSSIGSPPYFLKWGPSLTPELTDWLDLDPRTLLPKHWDSTRAPLGLDFIGVEDTNLGPQHLPGPSCSALEPVYTRPLSRCIPGPLCQLVWMTVTAEGIGVSGHRQSACCALQLESAGNY